MLECRGEGGQTVLPPSIHQTGEEIEIVEMGDPGPADPDYLLLQCKLIGAAIELAPYWQSGSRHDLSLAVAGALLRADTTLGNAEKVVRAICLLSDDEEGEDRLRAIETTAEKLVRGEPTTGWPTLSQLVGQPLCNHLTKWFGKSFGSPENHDSNSTAFTKNSLNDAGNAERTKRLFGHDLMYVPEFRRFFCWNGDLWIEDTDNLRTQTLCLDAVDYYLSDLSSGRSSTFDDEIVIKFLRGSRNRSKLSAQVDLLKSMVICDAKKLDANPDLIGCENGIIDLSTGSYLPPDRNAKITKRLGAFYDPDAVYPAFEKLLHDIFAGDQELMEFVQRLAGYWLNGSTKYHIFPILWGPGGCGKSKFVNAITAVLGDYATQMMADTLFEKTAGAIAQYDLATFRGRRFVVAQEAESQEKLKATMVKSLTGEDTMKVRLPYQDPWPLPPCAKFLMVGNQRPNIDPFDTGLKRRVRIIECAPPIPEEERDADLGEKLEREKSGILNWMLAGWSELKLLGGLRTPSIVSDSTQQFFNDKNEVSAFWEECVVEAPGEKVPKAALHEAYTNFSIQDGIEPRGKNEFGQILRTNFKVEEGRRGSTRFWKGISLRTGGTDVPSSTEADSITEQLFHLESIT